MRYRIEILYRDNSFDTVCFKKYSCVVQFIRAMKISSKYKDIRVYKLIGQYKINENMEIQHND